MTQPATKRLITEAALADPDSAIGLILKSRFPRKDAATFDIRDYGAKLDGATNDAPAVQAAIDAAAAAGGGVVYVPGQGAASGTKYCKINTTLRMKTGVWLRGAGASSVLSGPASPMIALPTSGPAVDRVTISDLFLQAPAGVGVYLDAAGLSGGYQLGWPRITVENVTVTDATGHAFHVTNSAVIELRMINCVSLRAGGNGFYINGTDEFLLACTAAGGALAGFAIQGAHTKITACKAYGNAGSGFDLFGGGCHQATGCEAQDNAVAGFRALVDHNVLSGCMSDSDGQAGYQIYGNFNILTGCKQMHGGGGTGQVAPIGFFFNTGTGQNKIVGATAAAATPVAGSVTGGNSATFDASGIIATTFASTIVPDPYYAETVQLTLSGNALIDVPAKRHRGQRLVFHLKQDGTGGRVVTFAGDYWRDGATLPTDAGTITRIAFVFDGAHWLQQGPAFTITPPGPGPAVAVADPFTRADNGSTLGSTPTGNKPWVAVSGIWGINGNQAASQADGANAIATVNNGDTDGIAQVKVATRDSGTGLVFRCTDANNFYLMLAGNGSRTFYKCVAGAYTDLGHTFAANAGDTLKVRAEDDDFVGYVNNVEVASFSDSSLGAGNWGIRADSTGGRLDDFAVALLS